MKETSSFVTLFTETQVEALYFVQVKEKGLMNESYVILTVMLSYQERYFKGHCPTLIRSRNISLKQLESLSTVIYLSPDELYNAYIDINCNLPLDISIYNSLLRKAKI